MILNDDGLNFKIVHAQTSGATLPLLASCIAASEKFEANKPLSMGTKNWLTHFDIYGASNTKDETLTVLQL